jgi:hypothetical protein
MMRRNQRARREMLAHGNSHLGPLIHAFSIPAFSTCPGATLACLLVCYALEFLFYVRSTLDKHRANWERTLAPDVFAADMIAEVRWKLVHILRIHVAGDFFGVAYIKAWIRIARACPTVKFLFYSRSWRVPALRQPLIELASLPNVFAWWSEDRDSGPSDMIVGRRCFLCVEAADEALVPPGVLVFREDVKQARKWVNGSWVCAKEQGIPTAVTCSHCGFCFDTKPLPTPPVARPKRQKKRVGRKRKLES